MISVRYPPFDWQLSRERSFNAKQAPVRGMEFFVEQGTGGVLARKVFAVSDGSVRLKGNFDVLQGEGTLKASVECVSGSAGSYGEKPLLDQSVWIVDAAGCMFAQITISGEAWDSSIPFKARILDLKVLAN